MKTNGHRDIVKFEFIFSGIMLIIYMDEPIAMIDENGKIIMRDDRYPVYLIDYLIQELNMHKYWLN